METLLKPTAVQLIENAAQTVNQTIKGVKERIVKSTKLAFTIPIETIIISVALLTIILAMYALLFAPPMPPCKDIY